MQKISKYIKILGQQSYPLRFLIASLLLYSGLSRFFTIHREGYKLHFSKSAIARLLWIDKHALKKDESFLRRYLRAGDNYIDVGANIGHLACCAAGVIGPKGNIVCVEANSNTFEALQNNLSLNGFDNAEAICKAVGENVGEISFNKGGSDDMHHVDVSGEVKNSSSSIECITLDSLSTHISNDNPESQTLLKIDIEGFELFAFKGGKEFLKSVDAIYFECNKQFCERYDHTQRDVFNELLKNGFNIYKIDDEVLTTFVHQETPDKANLIAVKNVSEFCARTGLTI